MQICCESPVRMSRTGPPDRLRSPLQGRGSTVSQQRTNFRKQFMIRLKSIRNDQVDRFRQLCEGKSEHDYASLLDLRKLFQPDREAMKLLDSKELMELLQQAEKEVLELQAEQFEKEIEQETEAIVQNLMNPCSLCETLITEGDICKECSQQFLNADPM